MTTTPQPADRAEVERTQDASPQAEAQRAVQNAAVHPLFAAALADFARIVPDARSAP